MKKLLTILLLSLYYLSAIVVIMPIWIILVVIDKVVGYLSYGLNRLSVLYMIFVEKYHDACYDMIH